jgi:hypothetical protein
VAISLTFNARYFAGSVRWTLRVANWFRLLGFATCVRVGNWRACSEKVVIVDSETLRGR